MSRAVSGRGRLHSCRPGKAFNVVNCRICMFLGKDRTNDLVRLNVVDFQATSQHSQVNSHRESTPTTTRTLRCGRHVGAWVQLVVHENGTPSVFKGLDQSTYEARPPLRGPSILTPIKSACSSVRIVGSAPSAGRCRVSLFLIELLR